MQLPSMRHTRTVLSFEHEARRLLSGAQHTPVIKSICPRSCKDTSLELDSSRATPCDHVRKSKKPERTQRLVLDRSWSDVVRPWIDLDRSQSTRVPSVMPPTEATNCVSGAIATAVTEPVCRRRTVMQVPTMSHSRTVLSNDADTTNLPCHATALLYPSCMHSACMAPIYIPVFRHRWMHGCMQIDRRVYIHRARAGRSSRSSCVHDAYTEARHHESIA